MAHKKKRRKLSQALSRALRAVTHSSEQRFAQVVGNVLRQKIGLAAKSKGSHPSRA